SWTSSPPAPPLPPSRTYLPASSGPVVSSVSVSTNTVGPAGVEVPKAYIFNQHNGLNYETSGPHLFPTHQPSPPGGQ
ncbi:hypothetical protein KR067_005641, partial [Drosophila pandora]